jgi:Tfp pilus assembly protein PilO
MVFMILFIIILIAVPPYFYIFVIQPKAQEIQALEKGPGGIAELTAQRDADKAFIANIEQYEKQLTDAQKELAKLKKSKKHK